MTAGVTMLAISGLIAIVILLGIVGAFRSRAVFEDGSVITESGEPRLFRLARMRLILVFLLVLCFGCGAAIDQGLIVMALNERLLFGFAFLLASGLFVIELSKGFLIGRMELGGISGERGQPDFWAIAGIFVLFMVVFGLAGLFLVIQAIL